jgi:WhiB family redox-sensing transcriptional regulator
MDLDKANCKDSNPDLFFPDDRGLYGRLQIKNARAICGSCDIKLQCLEYALKEEITEGIWGGLTYSERAPKHKAASKPQSNRPRVPMTPEAKARLAAYQAKKREESVARSAYKIDKYVGALNLALAVVTTEVPEVNLMLAKIKVENPELTLAEVGAMMEPPMSKDMTSGRLRRLIEASKVIYKARELNN